MDIRFICKRLMVQPDTADGICMLQGSCLLREENHRPRTHPEVICDALFLLPLFFRREKEIVRSLHIDWDVEFTNQCETFQKEQRYAEPVTLLERKCDAYQKQVAALGGLKELARMAGRPRGAIGFGSSDLFTGMYRYIDYNADFTPMNVEFVLMEAMPFRAREAPQLQALAARIAHKR